LVALILIAEVGIYTVASAGCLGLALNRGVPNPPGGVCSRIDNAVHSAYSVALNTLLALLGGKALIDHGNSRP
jgi:hypothetical protein